MPDLTAAEAAVYDRQLRVWGVETQKRLNAAKIIIVGCTGIAAEVAKNIVLAGCGRLALIDDTPCSSAPPGNFLVPASAQPAASVAAESAATLQAMNPLVKVGPQPASMLAWMTGANAPTRSQLSWLQEHTLILLAGADLATQVRYDEMCDKHGVAFYAVTSRGPCCHFFANLHLHAYTPAAEAAGQASLKKQVITYASLRQSLLASWRPLKLKRTAKLFFVVQACAKFELDNKRSPTADDLPMLQQLSAGIAAEAGIPAATAAAALDLGMLTDYVTYDEEMPAVNAVVGGVLANEVLKAVSYSGAPLKNMFFFSAHDGAGTVEDLSPASEL